MTNEYESFQGNKIDQLFAPSNGKGNLIINEIKRTNTNDIFYNLRRSITQVFERGYLLSAFTKEELDLEDVEKGYANYLEKKSQWDNIIVRGIEFYYFQHSFNQNQQNNWQVFIKDIILPYDIAKQIAQQTCKKSQFLKNMTLENEQNRLKIISNIVLQVQPPSTDIYEIFSQQYGGYSTLSVEQEFLDSFAESINIHKFGIMKKEDFKDIIMFMNNNCSTKKDFQKKLLEIKNIGQKDKKKNNQKTKEIANSWSKMIQQSNYISQL